MSEQDEGVPSGPAFYTATEAAELLRVDESTLYRHLRGGKFPGIKMGGRYVIPAAVIRRIVADIMATGRTLDLDSWTDQWRADQLAKLAQLSGVEVPGGVA